MSEFKDYSDQKNGNSERIDHMHDFDVNTRWSVRIFFPEKVHNTNV